MQMPHCWNIIAVAVSGTVGSQTMPGACLLQVSGQAKILPQWPPLITPRPACLPLSQCFPSTHHSLTRQTPCCVVAMHCVPAILTIDLPCIPFPPAVHAQACILRKCLKAGVPMSHDNLPELRILLHDTLLAAENLTPPFMRALARQGWQTEKIVVEAHRRRARW